jgi:DNA-directed RNA polymerase specialized sigma54-like protein
MTPEEIKALQDKTAMLETENNKLKEIVEEGIKENELLQTKLTDTQLVANTNGTNPIVKIGKESYEVLHGGTFEGFGDFKKTDVADNKELASELFKIGFGGFKKIVE